MYCVFPLFLNESRHFSGRKVRKNILVLRWNGLVLESAYHHSHLHLTCGLKKHHQRRMKLFRKEKPLQQQGIAAYVQTMAQKQVLLQVSFWGPWDWILQSSGTCSLRAAWPQGPEEISAHQLWGFRLLRNPAPSWRCSSPDSTHP